MAAPRLQEQVHLMNKHLHRPGLAFLVTMVSGCFCGNAAWVDENSNGGWDANVFDAGAIDSGTTDGGTNPCDGLSLHDCRLETRCVADLCDTCSCALSFEGCRLPSDPQPDCPVFGCATPRCCADDTECGPPLLCLPPDVDLGCGACRIDPGNCVGDADCQPGDICEWIACTCTGESECVPGCTADSECAQGEECSTASLNPRCLPAACGPSDPCEADFDCVTNQCQRRTCTDDPSCDNFCVLGRCYDSLGACGSLPP